MLTIIKKNDSKDVINYQLTNEDGSKVDLTGATVMFVMGKKTKIITNMAASVVSAIDGIVEYQLQDADTLVPGTFFGEFVVTFSDERRKTFPSNGYITVTIGDTLDPSQANVILDLIAERQGEFTAKLDSILLQAGNITMSAMNEFTWIATEGQITYVMPASANYNISSKWLQVTVENIPVDPDLVNRSIDDQFTLSIDAAIIKVGMKVHARWTEAIVPLTPGHKTTHSLGGQDEIDVSSLKNYQELVATPLVEKVPKTQMVEATTTFYVSTTGSDTNGGTTVGTAFATLQKAFDVINTSYLVINSTIKIDIQAGTYIQTSSIPTRLITKERLQIIGKKDVNGIPTVIFDGTGLSGSGIFGLEKDFLLVQDIKFQNYRNAGSTACGVHVQHFSNLWTNNVHIDNCDWGISVSANTRLYVQGGKVNNCRFGVRHYSNCVGTIGYNSGSLALGTVVTNCTQAGVYFQNQSSGHVDYCTVDANTSGVACVNQSRAHVLGCDIKNNTQEGVYVYHQSTWMNDNNTFTNNTKRWRTTAFSTELSTHGNSRSLLQSHIDTAQLTHTGTLTNTSIKTGLLIKGGSFVDSGRKLQIVATGTFAGAGTKTVSFRLSPAGVINSFTSTSTGGGSWKLEVEFFAVSATSQKHYAVWIEGDATSATTKTAYLPKSYDFNVDQTVYLYGQLADVTGSIIVETFEIQEVL